MFGPIKASLEIKASYIDYITTTFDLADPDYAKALRSELQREGMVAKGPYLDIGGSYPCPNKENQGAVPPVPRFQNRCGEARLWVGGGGRL